MHSGREFKCTGPVRNTQLMATNPEETRFESQRHRILKAAATCFNEKGFSGTSLKDVSRHLGLTDAALYYYVKNKEELVYQCYLRAAELGREAMDRAVRDGETGFDQAYLYIRYHVEIMVGDEGPVAIMSEIPSLKRTHRNEILEVSRQHSAGFEDNPEPWHRRRQHHPLRCSHDRQCSHGINQLDSKMVSRQGLDGHGDPVNSPRS